MTDTLIKCRTSGSFLIFFLSNQIIHPYTIKFLGHYPYSVLLYFGIDVAEIKLRVTHKVVTSFPVNECVSMAYIFPFLKCSCPHAHHNSYRKFNFGIQKRNISANFIIPYYLVSFSIFPKFLSLC